MRTDSVRFQAPKGGLGSFGRHHARLWPKMLYDARRAPLVAGLTGGARELASLGDAVDSRELFSEDGVPEKVPLGRALFLEIGSNWAGEPDIADPLTQALIEQYVGTDEQ